MICRYLLEPINATQHLVLFRRVLSDKANIDLIFETLFEAGTYVKYMKLPFIISRIIFSLKTTPLTSISI